MRRLGRLIRAVLLIWAASVAAIVIWTFLWPLDRTPPRADAIVCLGAGMGHDGGLFAGSRVRAESCAALARSGVAPVIVFSGGRVRDDGPSVAAAMAEAARAAGIGDAEVLLDDAAQSTLQNALFSLRLLPGEAQLLVVTEPYHLPRSWVSFRLMGAERVALHPATGSDRTPSRRPGPRTLLRESLAFWFNAGRYVVWRVGGALGVEEATRTAWLR